jgi:hypothetical protein
VTRLAPRCTWAALHRRWTATWDVLGRPGPCGLCGHPDRRHRVAEAILDRWSAGDQAAELASDYGLTVADVTRLVLAGGAAERARSTARVPRGREPSARPALTPTTSTT